MHKTGRHSWSEPHRYARHTDRACFLCGLVKRTRHEEGAHWVEYVDKGVVIARPGSPVPTCPGAVDHQLLAEVAS
jgi:hypothetical protein